ncbi:MAG: hypothetical protein VX152_09745 [Pseudomonadota bacterium]|nr:hypothetical protein [Pseudomonadota bacterium]MEC8155107.1 hypothetical protein [Pseudomonadota bacterium]
MNVVKRIIVLASSSALLVGLTGCSVIDSLNLGQLLRPGGGEDASGAAAAATAAPAPTSATPGGAPAPFDLSAATPASAFTMPAPVQTAPITAPMTAPIGAQSGFGTPSGFGSPLQQQPVAPTPLAAAPLTATPLTGTPVTRTATPMVGSVTYGAQPNPYAPRVPAAAAVPQTSLYQQPAVTSTTRATYQPAVSSALPQSGLAAANPYQPTSTSTVVTQTMPLQATSAASTPSSSMNPSINPENLSKSTISAIQAALKTRGLYSDTVDGVWGSKSKAAMARFLASRGEASVTLDTLFGLGVSL